MELCFKDRAISLNVISHSSETNFAAIAIKVYAIWLAKLHSYIKTDGIIVFFRHFCTWVCVNIMVIHLQHDDKFNCSYSGTIFGWIIVLKVPCLLIFFALGNSSTTNTEMQYS